MIELNQSFKAATPDTTRKNVEIGEALSPGPTGVLITIGSGASDRDLGRVESMVGHFIDARDYMLNNLKSLTEAAGPGVAIAVSCDSQGRLRPDGNNRFKLRVGPDLADQEASHAIDAMFKVCLSKLLEAAKTGYVPSAP